MREDQMVGCHHRLNGSELEQALAKKKKRTSSGSSWWTGKPGIRQSIGSQRVGYDKQWNKLETITGIYGICLSLSDLFHSAWQISRSIHGAVNRAISFFSWMSNVPIEYRYHLFVITFTWTVVLSVALFVKILSQQKIKNHTLAQGHFWRLY